MSKKKRLRPRNSYLAKANPASSPKMVSPKNGHAHDQQGVAVPAQPGRFRPTVDVVVKNESLGNKHQVARVGVFFGHDGGGKHPIDGKKHDSRARDQRHPDKEGGKPGAV